VLQLEVVLTKIFSVILWYHFAFLAISSVLFGFAAAGVFLTLWGATLEGRSTESLLARLSLVSACAIVVSLWLISHSHFDPFAVVRERQEAFLLFFILELVVPFFGLGLVIAVAIARAGMAVGRVYGANLIGSAAGCLTAALALDQLGGIRAACAAATLVIAGAFLFAAAGSGSRSRLVILGMAVGMAVLTLSHQPDRWFEMRAPASKPLAQVSPAQLAYSRWDSLAKVDIYKSDRPVGLWALSDRFSGPFPQQFGVIIDAWAVTSILDGHATREAAAVLEYLPSTAVYRIRQRPDVLLIGAGGGLDIAAALHFGSPRVTGIEINRSIVEAVRGPFASFSGELFTHPGVEVVVAEGRHYLERHPRKVEVLQLSGVDTAAATAAGAFSLSENFLYTREAFATYLDHLAPDGILTLTRWYIPSPTGHPRFALRLFALALQGLEDVGVSEPLRHIYYFAHQQITVILIGRRPLSVAEVATLDRYCAEYGYTVLFAAGRAPARLEFLGHSTTNFFRDYAYAVDRRAYARGYPFDISVPTDDRPFYFENSRWSRLFEADNFYNPLGGMTGQAILLLLLIECALLGFGFLGLPLLAGRRHDLRHPLAPSCAAYFTLLGAGFILAEVIAAQKFVLYLGHPFYALTVVLFALLLASGVGSVIAARLERLARLAPALIAAWLVLYAIFLDPIFRATLRFPLPARIALAAAILALPGLFLGMPFPTGLRVFQQRAPALVPWAWAVNGYASVLGSVGAIILAMTLGFKVTLGIAAALYLLAGWLLMRWPAQRESTAT
jgi:SAM-dependent methyltransferase